MSNGTKLGIIRAKLAQMWSKLLNLRVMDRRNVQIRLYLADPKALELSDRRISMTYDYENDVVEYYLSTRAGMSVQPRQNLGKITNM